MSGDRANFSDSGQQSDQQTETTPFHETDLHSAPSERAEAASPLKHCSPDMPVVAARDLKGDDLQKFRESWNNSYEQWEKVAQPVRSVIANAERQQEHGTSEEAESSLKWARNYCAKVEEVVNDNIKAATSDMDKRVAVGRQSFSPGPDGKPIPETLYAMFPPPETKIIDGHVAIPLHSADPRREAELRSMPPSLANYATVFEMKFALAAMDVIPRRKQA
ncbi:MAG: hypothetical protein K2X77_26770 [Candidatus Obscuribacterales bacterium]|nr:hypothetical protein [Candidatus Obscuribacterales bacterium]